jgi:hypothetical protein
MEEDSKGSELSKVISDMPQRQTRAPSAGPQCASGSKPARRFSGRLRHDERRLSSAYARCSDARCTPQSLRW